MARPNYDVPAIQTKPPTHQLVGRCLTFQQRSYAVPQLDLMLLETVRPESALKICEMVAHRLSSVLSGLLGLFLHAMV